MGISSEDALSSIRISVGRDTTQNDIQIFLEKLTQIIRRLQPSQT